MVVRLAVVPSPRLRFCWPLLTRGLDLPTVARTTATATDSNEGSFPPLQGLSFAGLFAGKDKRRVRAAIGNAVSTRLTSVRVAGSRRRNHRNDHSSGSGSGGSSGAPVGFLHVRWLVGWCGRVGSGVGSGVGCCNRWSKNGMDGSLFGCQFAFLISPFSPLPFPLFACRQIAITMLEGRRSKAAERREHAAFGSVSAMVLLEDASASATDRRVTAFGGDTGTRFAGESLWLAGWLV